MLDENDWELQERNANLGACLAVADRTCDLQEWVVDHCRQLPLSAWDADDQEDLRMFNTAEQVAQHWFLVAFHSILPLGELGRRIDPTVVLSLTEKFFGHCHYAQPYVFKPPASSSEAEYVARYAVEFGRASMQWLLDLARHPAVGARILWAMVNQVRLRNRASRGMEVQDLTWTRCSSLSCPPSRRVGLKREGDAALKPSYTGDTYGCRWAKPMRLNRPHWRYLRSR